MSVRSSTATVRRVTGCTGGARADHRAVSAAGRRRGRGTSSCSPSCTSRRRRAGLSPGRRRQPARARGRCRRPGPVVDEPRPHDPRGGTAPVAGLGPVPLATTGPTSRVPVHARSDDLAAPGNVCRRHRRHCCCDCGCECRRGAARLCPSGYAARTVGVPRRRRSHHCAAASRLTSPGSSPTPRSGALPSHICRKPKSCWVVMS